VKRLRRAHGARPHTRAISLQAPQDVKLKAGLTLPPGLYSGTEERIRADSIGGPSWTVKYKITLTEEQLATIGATLHPDLSSADFDVTAFVRQGQLAIGQPGKH
jgi:hypothetical protein